MKAIQKFGAPNCTNYPDAYYPITEYDNNKFETNGAIARSLCAGCPMAIQCLDVALVNDDPHGIWGGLNRTERKGLTASIAIKSKPELPKAR